MKKIVFWLLTAFWLSSCSTTSNQIPGRPAQPANVADQQKNWQARQRKLLKQSAWKLGGRASVTYRNDNWPFGIQWQQQSLSQYNMRIKHPLTQNTLANITKKANQITLKANGRMYTDSSPENLVEKHLHVKLPVSGMQYWVRGLTSPAYPVARLVLDGVGRPQLIQQAGWTIRYLRYQGSSVAALPETIVISRSVPRAVQVKMRIKQWL